MPKLKRANEYFGISEKVFSKTGAFNPIIGVDSLFFVDPLLLGVSSAPEFKNALAKVRHHFEIVIALLKTKNTRGRVKAEMLLRLREIRGIGIGYGSKSDDGSAIGRGLASRLATTAEDLIAMGITDPVIFEVMGLFEEDFGADRLSDSLINLLREDVYKYTNRIAGLLKIPMTFSVQINGKSLLLPMHPLGGKPLLFLPKEILRSIPVATSFEEISIVAGFNEELRGRFNALITECFVKGKKLTKVDVKRYLLASRSRIKTLVEAYESCLPAAYDFVTDPSGLDKWLEKAEEAVGANPIVIPRHIDDDQLSDVVNKIIAAFRNFIEKKGGWRGLYNDAMQPLNERHARLFFYAAALKYCEDSNIDISPESNAGQGPVDFKLSRGTNKIVVEVKLTSGNVRQGYEKQTRIYQASEGAMASYFLVVRNTPDVATLNSILKQSEEEDKTQTPHPRIVVVDGTQKLSASKVK